MKSSSFSIEFVNANAISAVNAISSELVKGQTSSVLVQKSMDADMNKGTKNNRNPFLGRVEKTEWFGGWSLGTNYGVCCENAVARSGSEETFEQKQVWHTYYNAFFQTDKKTHSKFYLQLQRGEKQGSKVTTIITIDGEKVATLENGKVTEHTDLYNELLPWLKKKEHKMSSSQIEAGVTKENERHYTLLALENIQCIIQGQQTQQVIKLNKLAEAECESK